MDEKNKMKNLTEIGTIESDDEIENYDCDESGEEDEVREVFTKCVKDLT